MKDNRIPSEIIEVAMSSLGVERAMRLRNLGPRTSMIRGCEVPADLYTTQIMTEDMKDLLVGGPELTPDDWHNLVFILERRIDYCETQMALVGKIGKSSGEEEVSIRRHFEGELAAAQALFSKIDATRPLT